MKLRPYLADGVEAVWDHIAHHDTNPLVVLPTGSGKTPLIAQLCADAVQQWEGRVVVLSHVKELVSQTVEKLQHFVPNLPIGVFAAGLGRRELGHAITVASIHSIYDRAFDLGPVNLVIVDEAHLIPPDGEGMYRRFLVDTAERSERRRVIGLTATPYRMSTGPICGPDHFLHEICFEVGVHELVTQGYLSPLRSRAGVTKVDVSSVRRTRGEYASGELESLMNDDQLVAGACGEIVEATRDRKAVLIFCSGVDHGEHVAREFREAHGLECGFVSGETPDAERDELVARFRSGDLKYLANVQVLTVGFDAPHIDCVAMLRPTLSPGLYYQMVGRGLRKHEGKEDCLVLDFAGNVITHGPIDAIRLTSGAGDGEAPVKECPGCRLFVPTATAVCPECGHAFPPRKVVRHGVEASEAPVLSGEPASAWNENVAEVSYHVHFKASDPSAKPTMKVSYRVGFSRWHHEWVCLEHPLGSYPRRKATEWWLARSNEPCPSTVEEAVDLANAGALAEPTRIALERKPGDRWERIVSHVLGPKPPRLESDDDLPEPAACIDELDGIPF